MNIEKGYLAISIGEENRMFTLRSHSTHIDGWGNAVESELSCYNLALILSRLEIKQGQ
jgi:hypothetical protein